MNFTAQVRATVKISDATSPERRLLSVEDFELFVDEITEALELSGEAGNVTLGASLAQGWLEASYSVEAPDIWEAQTKAMRLMETAQTVAARTVGRRLADGPIAQLPRIVSAHVDELIPA